MLTYEFDLTKLQTDGAKSDLKDYISRVAAKYEHHCSILINNLALHELTFKDLSPQQIGEMTNIKVENHSMVNKLITVDLRNKSLRKYRTLVIDVGTTEYTLVEKERKFKK